MIRINLICFWWLFETAVRETIIGTYGDEISFADDYSILLFLFLLLIVIGILSFILIGTVTVRPQRHNTRRDD